MSASPLRPIPLLVSLALLFEFLIDSALALVPVAAILLLAQEIGPAGSLGLMGLLFLSPALYVTWLLAFFVVSAGRMRLVALLGEKRRHVVLRSDRATRSPGVWLFLSCYARGAVVRTLPLARALCVLPTFPRLVLGSFSPRVRLGRGVTLYGEITDPDLTDIGDDVVIGDGARLVAHVVAATAPDELTIASAEIRIGARATIGGGALVALGCSVGEDAVIEPMANLLPFTRVPAGEVWGGNPATLRRHRIATRSAASESIPGAVSAHTLPARELVAEALSLPLSRVGDDSGPADLAPWDSLGQISLAASLHARFGIDLAPDALFALNTVRDVQRLIDSRIHGGPAQPSSDEDLPEDPELLPLGDLSARTRALTLRASHPLALPPLAVLVAATFTAQPLRTALRAWCHGFGFDADVSFAAFDRVAEALLDPASPLRSHDDGMAVVLARVEDLLDADGGISGERVEALLGAIATFARDRPGRLVVGTLPPLLSPLRGIARSSVDALRLRWRAGLEAIPDLDVAEVGEAIEALGTEAAADPDGEAILSSAWTARAHERVAIVIARAARRRRVPAKKVLALDCDGVLWGGVLGEDGPGGIVLAAHGAGRPFHLIQQQARELAERGVLIALVSRNEERDVRAVLAQHDGMVLRPEHVACWRVGWAPKSQSLRDIAAELNLSLDQVVFVDDDPAQRLEVEANAPRVTILPLPAAPAQRPAILARLWAFDAAPPTAEDLARTRRIGEERERDEIRAGRSLPDYLADLGLVARVRPAMREDIARLSQLTQRTNQFNLSLRRRSPDEISALLETHDVLTISAGDRFGDYGLIGACALTRGRTGHDATLDTLLMSCRALGRGLEQAFLSDIAEAARERGSSRLLAPLVSGPRNEPLRRFLAESGFTADSLGTWALPLDAPGTWPSHIGRG